MRGPTRFLSAVTWSPSVASSELTSAFWYGVDRTLAPYGVRILHPKAWRPPSKDLDISSISHTHNAYSTSTNAQREAADHLYNPRCSVAIREDRLLRRITRTGFTVVYMVTKMDCSDCSEASETKRQTQWTRAGRYTASDLIEMRLPVLSPRHLAHVPQSPNTFPSPLLHAERLGRAVSLPGNRRLRLDLPTEALTLVELSALFFGCTLTPSRSTTLSTTEVRTAVLQ